MILNPCKGFAIEWTGRLERYTKVGKRAQIMINRFKGFWLTSEASKAFKQKYNFYLRKDDLLSLKLLKQIP
jgi:hypothetical protein